MAVVICGQPITVSLATEALSTIGQQAVLCVRSHSSLTNDHFGTRRDGHTSERDTENQLLFAVRSFRESLGANSENSGAADENEQKWRVAKARRML